MAGGRRERWRVGGENAGGRVGGRMPFSLPGSKATYLVWLLLCLTERQIELSVLRQLRVIKPLLVKESKVT